MIDEETLLKREVERGNAAAQVLNNIAYQTAFTKRKAQIFDTFCSTGHDQAAERQAAWLTMQNLISIENELQSFFETGKMAIQQLKNMD